ncbi:MAG: tetratricopeptide repeat protein [Candidatus Falkowbacteria bacterium]
MNRKTIAILIGALLLITVAAYSPIEKNNFLSSDDGEQVVNNQDIRQWSLAGAARIFGSYYVGMYQPLTTLGYAAEYRLFGPDARAFHLDSLALHLLAVGLVIWLSYLLFDNWLIAILAGSFFALWPTQVEAVAWVSARSTLLSSLGILAVLVAYLYYLRQPRRWLLALVYLLALLAILCKVSAVILPLLLLLISRLRESNWKKCLRVTWPLWLLSLLFGLVAIRARQNYGFFVDEKYNWSQSLMLMGASFTWQIKLLFAPFNLSAFYPQPLLATFSWFWLAIPAAYLAVCWFVRKQKILLFGLCWFLLQLILSIQIMPHTIQIGADRYNYLALLGLIWPLLIRLRLLAPSKRRLAVIGATALLAVMAITDWGQAQTWQSDLTLWQNAARISKSAPIIWYNLAEVNRASGNYGESLAIADEQLVKHPDYANFYYLRGLIALQHNQLYAQAAADFQTAIKLQPALPAYYYNLALAQSALGQTTAALQNLDLAEVKIAKPKQKMYLPFIQAQRQLLKNKNNYAK